ncbi:MAG: hypothetical protein J0G28_14540 [Afipia sp.]|nr:hypothetical protein [Afipia sp.]OJW65516.1 MAG: hypothetical protein BGO65_12375 [Afipia sp. 64-13]
MTLPTIRGACEGLAEFTEAWLRDAIDLVSFCIVEDGPVYAPILERLEAELQILQRREDVMARARRNLVRRRDEFVERDLVLKKQNSAVPGLEPRGHSH